jgi:hypothetical protein
MISATESFALPSGTAIPGCALGFFLSANTLRPQRLCVKLFS